VLFCVFFFTSIKSTKSELSSEEPDELFINDEIRINVVFLGISTSPEDQAELEQSVIDWHAPIDLEQSIRNDQYIPAGANFSLDIKYFNAPDEMVEDLTEFHNRSIYSDSEVEDYLDSQREEYLEEYYDELYGEDDYGDFPVFTIDARKTEDWLQLNAEGYAGLDGVLDEYTLFITFPNYAERVYYYSVNTTDTDTNREFYAKNINAYGGNYNFFFIDWWALPPRFGDGFGFGEIAEMENYSPFWYTYSTGEEPDDTYLLGSISKYVNESIQYLFLPSYIYTPTYELEYELDLVAIDCTDDDSFYDVAEWYIDRDVIEDELERVIPYGNWTFEILKVDVDDLPDLREELDRTTETETRWFDEHKIIDSSALKVICDTYITRPQGVITIPVFIFVFDEYGWVDSLWTGGRAEGNDDATFWGVLMANGMENMDDNGYGLTQTITHEIGHILGLMHPHDGFTMDESGVSFSTSWFWDFSATPMGYYSKLRLYEFNTFNKDALDRGHVLYLLNQTLWKWHAINTTLLEKRYTYDVLPEGTQESVDGIYENVTSSIYEFKDENYFIYQYGVWDAWSYAITAYDLAQTTYNESLNLSIYNHPPTITLLSPGNNTENVSLDAILTWQGVDNDTEDSLTYSLYFGEGSVDALSLVLEESEAMEYDPSLTYGTVYYWKVVVRDGEHIVESEIWSFSALINHPPEITLLTPADGADEVSLDAILTWQGVDDDPEDSLTYSLYFSEGSIDALSLVLEESKAIEYNLDLAYGTTYYWKVVVHDGVNIVESEIWSFSSLINHSPEITLLTPADGADEVSIDALLSWQGSDVDTEDELKYSVHIGAGSLANIAQASENQTDDSFNPILTYETPYFWKIVVTDGINTEESAVWFFTTIVEPKFEPEENKKPTAYINSIIPDTTTEGVSIRFVGIGSDADGSVVRYVWRSSIDGEFYNGTAAAFSYSQLSVGTHTVYFTVQDNGSAWSDEAILTVIVEEKESNGDGAGFLTGFEVICIFTALLGAMYLRRRMTL